MRPVMPGFKQADKDRAAALYSSGLSLHTVAKPLSTNGHRRFELGERVRAEQADHTRQSGHSLFRTGQRGAAVRAGVPVGADGFYPLNEFPVVGGKVARPAGSEGVVSSP